MPSPTTPLSGENETIEGAAGTWVSTVTLNAVEAALVIPATVSVAVKLWVALLNAAVAKLQAPLPLAVALPSSVAPSYTFTALLATAVPVSVRTFALVMPSPTTPLSGENEAMVGAAGPVEARFQPRTFITVRSAEVNEFNTPLPVKANAESFPALPAQSPKSPPGLVLKLSRFVWPPLTEKYPGVVPEKVRTPGAE